MTLVTKSLGIDQTTQLQIQLNVWGFDVNDKISQATIAYDLVLLAPNNAVAHIISTGTYTRRDIPAVLYNTGEIITPAIYYKTGEMMDVTINGVVSQQPAIGGEIKTPAIIATGTEVKIPASNSYTNLKNSQPGVDILAMLNADAAKVQSIQTIQTDLAQK